LFEKRNFPHQTWPYTACKNRVKLTRYHGCRRINALIQQERGSPDLRSSGNIDISRNWGILPHAESYPWVSPVQLYMRGKWSRDTLTLMTAWNIMVKAHGNCMCALRRSLTSSETCSNVTPRGSVIYVITIVTSGCTMTGIQRYAECPERWCL